MLGAVASRRFPPLRTRQESAAAPDGLLAILASDPHTQGQARSRWTLAALRAVVPSFAHASLSGIWRVLAAARLRRKRARDHLHSPDPTYQEKLAYLAQSRAAVAAAPDQRVLLYLDEVTYYRQPSLASAYARAGSTEPHAQRSTRSNTTTRVISTLDAASGRVVAAQRSKITVPAFIGFLRTLVDAYPGRHLTVVLDNWPVHFHPAVLAVVEPQVAPAPFYRPDSWSRTSVPAIPTEQRLPIQLVPLPTYAPWLNPIEKLWRWLKQDVLHLHHSADDLEHLRSLVLDFLARFQHASDDLLRYVGLLPD